MSGLRQNLDPKLELYADDVGPYHNIPLGQIKEHHKATWEKERLARWRHTLTDDLLETWFRLTGLYRCKFHTGTYLHMGITCET